MVGKGKALGVAIAAGVEHEMADRIRRIMTVVENLVHGFEARDRLVLAEGYEQIGERIFGNVADANCFSESYKYRMPGFAAIAGVEFLSPEIEQSQRLLAVPHFVAEIVGDAAVGVDAVKVRAQALGQKPRGHVEIFVV